MKSCSSCFNSRCLCAIWHAVIDGFEQTHERKSIKKIRIYYTNERICFVRHNMFLWKITLKNSLKWEHESTGSLFYHSKYMFIVVLRLITGYWASSILALRYTVRSNIASCVPVFVIVEMVSSNCARGDGSYRSIPLLISLNQICFSRSISILSRESIRWYTSQNGMLQKNALIALSGQIKSYF